MDVSELDDQLEKKNLFGYWKVRASAQPPEPPYIWKWKDVREGLINAKDTIGLELAERRSLRLVNPNLAVQSTSRNLQFSFSIIKPGEIAKAHRHNLAAIRFVVEGRGAYTIVEGERFLMEEGDLILTPNWTWHDHINESEEPIIWLDGLDVPLIQTQNIVFFEQYEKDVQRITRNEGQSVQRLQLAPTPAAPGNVRRGIPFRYGWKESYGALKTMGEHESNPYDGNLLRYINPVNGGPTLATMSCEVQLIQAGKTTKTHRHASTALYHVFKGRGRTAVEDSYLEWEKGDCFVVPPWQWHRHETRTDEEAVLFSINDRPIMEALELYREEGEDVPPAR